MRRVAVAVAVAVGLLAAGCGGSKRSAAPAVALLASVRADPSRVVFGFASAPREVRTRFVRPAQVVESGSGRRVPLRGAIALVVSFAPAATADLQGEKVVVTYDGPRRLRPRPGGPVQELAKVGDFEAQLDWAVGLDRRRTFHVTREGPRVTVTFGS